VETLIEKTSISNPWILFLTCNGPCPLLTWSIYLTNMLWTMNIFGMVKISLLIKLVKISFPL